MDDLPNERRTPPVSRPNHTGKARGTRASHDSILRLTTKEEGGATVIADPSFPHASWASKFLERWLDKDHQPSSDALRQHKWVVLPVPDRMGLMEAEWLADAIRHQGIEEAIGVAFEYNGPPILEWVRPSRDSLLEYECRNSFRYTMITSSKESFLYYRDQGNEFFLLCGSADFISDAYKCSWETAKMIYFEYWVNDECINDQEKRFLTDVWNKYASNIV